MPTYQYRCTECGHDLEAVQKFSDAPLTECPNCGGSLRKVFNAVGVVFKGSGFYRTDSRTNGKTSSESSTTGAAKPAASSGSGEKPSTSSSSAGNGAATTPTGTKAPASSTATSGS